MKERAWLVSTTAFLLLSAVFVIGSVLVIFSQAVYIPYWDQWDWMRRYLPGTESAFSLSFTPINGHIVAIPGLLYRADISLFRASNIANLTVMLACIVAICLILRTAFSSLSERFRGRTANVYFATALMLMVWFHSWENLFWPFQVHQYISLLLSALALLVLSAAAVKNEPRAVATGVAVAMAIGLLASASFGVGLAVWGAAVVIMTLSRQPLAWRLGGVATAIGLAALLVWYLTPWLAHNSAALETLTALNFVAMFLGSPLFHGGNLRGLATDVNQLSLVIGVGYFGLALACTNVYRLVRAWRHRRLGQAELFLVGVMVFSLSTAVMAAVARSGVGLPSPALSSRYGVMCLLFWLSAVPLFVASLSPSKASIRRYETFVPVCLLVLVAGSQSAYLEWWTKWKNLVEVASASLVSAVPDREYLGYIFPPDRLQVVESVTTVLMREGTSPLFAERSRFIGHPLTDFGVPNGACPATVIETTGLAAGVRIKGFVTDTATPFSGRKVLVTDDRGIVIGVGAVGKRWPGLEGDPEASRKRQWIAYAPVGESALNSIYVYILREHQLCSVEGLHAGH